VSAGVSARRRRETSLTVATALLWLSAASSASAQVSGSMTLLSDYRERGVSLSDGKPAAQAGIGFDHDSGWYAGVTGSTVDFGDHPPSVLYAVVYAGFARRAGPVLSWDAGASFAAVPGGEYDYAEIHAGLMLDKVSARVSYAPNYFGQGIRAIYAEANAALPVRERWTLVGHAGALRLLPRGDGPAIGTTRFDARAGVERDFDWARLQVAWVASSSTAALYPVRRGQSRSTIVVSISHVF